MLSPAAPQERCLLKHLVFSQFGEPLFRRAETDGTPVMVVMLGDREAALPLRSLQREFGIAEDTADGRMLGLVAAALDFVTCLRLGDPLPAEVLSGQASWEPTQQHFRLANTRLQLQLVDWLRAGSGEDHAGLDSQALLTAVADPVLRQQIQEAFGRAAVALNLADAEAVVALVEMLAQELAFVEALREWLLQPMQTMAGKLARLVQGWRGDAAQHETLTQVRRLTGMALRQIGGRFDELDAHTGEVLAALRNLEGQRTFIRTNRDWLYRTHRAWQPIFADWDAVGPRFDEQARTTVERSYRFLAPRFMPVTEWISVNRGDGKPKEAKQRGMVW